MTGYVRIYQLKDVETLYTFRQFDKNNFSVDDYELVYSGEIENTNLGYIFEKFNINRPEDFEGHSLSVSDIVYVKDIEGYGFFYCQPIGWKNVSEYFVENY